MITNTLKLLVISVIAALLCFGAEVAKPTPEGKSAAAAFPKPIPPEKHEEISRAMIRVQAAQLDLVQAQARAKEAASEYQAIAAKLRTELGAPEGCEITLDKQWSCPPAGEPKKKQ